MRWRRPLLETVSDHVKTEVSYQYLRHLQRLLQEDQRHDEGLHQLHQLRDQGDGARRAQVRSQEDLTTTLQSLTKPIGD